MQPEQVISKSSILIFEGKVPTGFPSPAMDYMEKRIDLNEVLIKHPLSTFICESEGLSMINAFIPPRAKLIVDRSITPKNGDIVLASINGEFTVKYLKKNDFKCWLCPANSTFKDIEITEEMDMQVFGVVTTILITPNEIKSCMH
ncbi:translesion error-prone DNA polymerase V autoproteolytic subunit [Ginsengibacter hankyongi]|uniref:Translesion error-prone DNA polymerase V autoproteolytic subunit n=2 Tax=Ginsengibacter hankyongi TaxID=2607284 RepID=A0A5J5IEN6_9BACT|nr:translesion error-prone DNA polymerase V autoproteolytic subunit [Ginsengibacter hankyongi]